MSSEKATPGKLKISLRENGLHSFWRGIDGYGEYDKNHSKWALKDAIIFFHHGIELLMKEILVKNNPFLIFEDLRDATKKQLQADEKKIGIFFLDAPPKTVSYEEAINRVCAFVKPSELDVDLKKNLLRLNQFRNQLEHYEIEVEQHTVTQLLAALHEPVTDLFEKQIGGVRATRPANLSQIINKLLNAAKETNYSEKEVLEIMSKFDGQKALGRFFNSRTKVVLPKFARIVPRYKLTANDIEREVDAYGEVSNGVSWAVEIKKSFYEAISSTQEAISHSRAANAQLWIVLWGDARPLRKLAKRNGVSLTGIKELRELRKFLFVENANHESVAG